VTLVTTLRLPGARRDPFSRAMAWCASTRPGSKVFAVALPPLDRGLSRLTGGRATFTEVAAGLPTVYLTTRGARSGQDRTVPLLGVPMGGDVVVVGSNWGGTKHPGWVHNLVASPSGRLAYRGREAAVGARELVGDEAERAWALARATYRGYRLYPERTGGREIRLFRLTQG
jgi:deazaflavin-dependent oxidoreductase (nitroreductase family)